MTSLPFCGSQQFRCLTWLQLLQVGFCLYKPQLLVFACFPFLLLRSHDGDCKKKTVRIWTKRQSTDIEGRQSMDFDNSVVRLSMVIEKGYSTEFDKRAQYGYREERRYVYWKGHSTDFDREQNGYRRSSKEVCHSKVRLSTIIAKFGCRNSTSFDTYGCRRRRLPTVRISSIARFSISFVYGLVLYLNIQQQGQKGGGLVTVPPLLSVLSSCQQDGQRLLPAIHGEQCRLFNFVDLVALGPVPSFLFRLVTADFHFLRRQ